MFSALPVVGLVAIGMRVVPRALLGGGVPGRMMLVAAARGAAARMDRRGAPRRPGHLRGPARGRVRRAAARRDAGLPGRRERAGQPAPAAALRARHAVRRGHGRRRGAHLRPADGRDAGRVRAARRLRGHSARGLRELRAAGRAGDGGGAGPFARTWRPRWSRAGTVGPCTGTERRGGGAGAMRIGGLLDLVGPTGCWTRRAAAARPAAGPGRRRAGRPALLGGARRETRSRYRPRPVGPAGVAGVVRRPAAGGGAGRSRPSRRGRASPRSRCPPRSRPCRCQPSSPSGAPHSPVSCAPVPPQRALLQAGAGRTS